ncbi:amino acid ABC transporter substrate-binding protein [Acetivibrio sp. MSJd-27]|uniref:amino acid ABC transporter substrate-binding protein n=1 Tax=Acetivibrio sp. MSJd-27 TaxID=2841523 RepID=UPI00209E2E52|nr:amino acid ABC transporter substrate-binding protein [Acetivibrio sp. MSJd-27]
MKKMNWKKILCAALATVLATVSFAGCGGDDSAVSGGNEPSSTPAADTSWTDIQSKGKMVVGLDDSVPPMGFRDPQSNEIVGVDIDLAKAVAEKLGIQVEFKAIDWKAKEAELNTKKIDIIWNGFTITAARKQEVLFSEPYMDNTQAIIVAKGSAIKTKSDLKGKKIGVQAGSPAEDAIKDDDIELYNSIGAGNINKYDTILMALLDLEAGRVDAVVADETVARYTITESGKEYEILSENFLEEEYGVGFRKTDVAFKTEFDKAFKAIKEDGTAAKISEKWFQKNIIK